PSPLRGKVVVSGTEGMHFTTLQTMGGSVLLTGALESELRALSGATVQVSGTESRREGRASVDVRSYEVVDIDGERPVVGRLLASNRLVTGTDTLTLAAAISAPAGAKVWVTGDRSGKQIAVRSFGIIQR
ncbi:MAG: hypothetical protein ACREMA_17100, partial [Longimicrobiales bacterium]